MTKLTEARRQYDYSSLTRSQLNTNPFRQMEAWLDQAKQADLKDATAMTLATTGTDGMPDARIVLLKELDESGLCWYTEYSSTKGRQLAENPRACLLFHWRELDRQIRVQGTVVKLSVEEAEVYFHARPLESQFSAAASEQSQPIESRKLLEEKVRALQRVNVEFVNRPEHWGGYRLIPSSFEFWQGRENRLHDRFSYSLNEAAGWLITRLQP